jgi:hypothetical protein
MEAEKWFPLYKKIQEKGKNLVIDSSPMGVSRLYKYLDSHGLLVRVHLASRFDAKLFLPKFVNGWGDFLGKKPSILAEDYLIPKNKIRVKLINKFT